MNEPHERVVRESELQGGVVRFTPPDLLQFRTGLIRL